MKKKIHFTPLHYLNDHLITLELFFFLSLPLNY